MKVIRKYKNGYLDVKAEGEVENYYEKGEFIEVEYKYYLIYDYRVEDGRNVYTVKPVY